MDMSEVKAFNAELSGLYDNKPPISKAKMSAITRGAIKAIKFYKHVVHSVEKFIAKCKPEYKVPGLYVIDSIVRQSRHQFGQDKDVFAPRFAKNMQQTCAHLFRCPHDDKRNIIRVLNLWQKNSVFGPDVIQPLLDMADPNHPIHVEIQQQQQQQQLNSSNGSVVKTSSGMETKSSPAPPLPPLPPAANAPEAPPARDQGSSKFKKLLNEDFEYESDDDNGATMEPLPAPPPSAPLAPPPPTSIANIFAHQQTAEALGSILTNPEILRQLQSLQAQMHMMSAAPLTSMMSDIQMPTGNPPQMLPFLSKPQETETPKGQDATDDGGNNESDIEFVEAGPQIIEIDANDSSRSPTPSRSRRRRSRSRSRSRRRSRSRSNSRKERRRDKDKEKEREKEREKEKKVELERKKRGLPPIMKEHLSVCSTTLWVGHLSKLTVQEELFDVFGEIGGVASIDMVAPRGCAYIVMERRQDAARAHEKLDRYKLHLKSMSVAWAPGKGVKGREWKDYWDLKLGVSYLPWDRLQQQYKLGLLDMDALEEGGWIDDETLPPWVPPRSMPVGNMMIPPGGPPHPAMLVPPLLPPGLPGMPPGMPGQGPPTVGTPVPGIPVSVGDVPMPPGPSLLGFPPGLPPPRLPPPGMVAGFMPGMVGMPPGLLPPGMPMHIPPPSAAHIVPPNWSSASVTHMDDAMELDTEEHGDDTDSAQPPQPDPSQLQAMMMNPPPVFNMPPPALGQKEEAPPPAAESKDKEEDKERERDRDRRERDRRDRDRRDRRDDRRDRDRNRDRDRDRDDRRDNRDKDSKDKERDKDKDKDKDKDRDRGRDRRDRDRDRNNRDRNRENRERSPRTAAPPAAESAPGGGSEKSLQERLWEMANGNSKPPPSVRENNDPAPPTSRHDQPPPLLHNPPDMENEGAEQGGSGWTQLPPPMHQPPNVAPTFRADLRMRGPPRGPPRGGPWMDGIGPRFNGPPPFNRPPFMRPPFGDGAMFDGPPPFNRPPFDGPMPPFDGPIRPPFDGPIRPPFDGPNRPPFDGPNRPPFDGPNRPPFDGPNRPPFDGPNRPPFDGPNRPPFDGPNRPPFDGPNRPPFDGPNRPPFDGPNRPPFDGPNRPPFDGSFDPNDMPFDDEGPREFDRNGRPPRYEDGHEFGAWDRDNERGDWEGRGRGDWDREDRYRERIDRRHPREDYRNNTRDQPRPDNNRNNPRDQSRTNDQRSNHHDQSRPDDLKGNSRDQTRSDDQKGNSQDQPRSEEQKSNPRDQPRTEEQKSNPRDQPRSRERDRKSSRWGNKEESEPEPKSADTSLEQMNIDINNQNEESNILSKQDTQNEAMNTQIEENAPSEQSKEQSAPINTLYEGENIEFNIQQQQDQMASSEHSIHNDNNGELEAKNHHQADPSVHEFLRETMAQASIWENEVDKLQEVNLENQVGSNEDIFGNKVEQSQERSMEGRIENELTFEKQDDHREQRVDNRCSYDEHPNDDNIPQHTDNIPHNENTEAPSYCSNESSECISSQNAVEPDSYQGPELQSDSVPSNLDILTVPGDHGIFDEVMEKLADFEKLDNTSEAFDVNFNPEQEQVESTTESNETNAESAPV